MLAAEYQYGLFANVALPKQELLEIHRSKISLHHAKTGYDYPTIRLPHILSRLIGSSTRIYQTIHDGALAFLVVIAPSDSASENAPERAKPSVLTWRRSPVRIRPSPSFFLQSEVLEPSIGPLLDTRIMARKKHDEDKKLHNSRELDLSWQETVDLQSEDENEEGSEIYYFVDQDGNINSREFLAEELIEDEFGDLHDLPEGKRGCSRYVPALNN
jgi:hypothetical protein